MDENNKEYVDFIIQMIKEINKNSDFLPKDVCHVLNRRPIIDHLRNSVKNDDDFETILSGWINRCIIKPSECIWQAIFAVSVLKKQNSIKEKISILYSQTENLYKNVENDDGKKAEYLDALLALFWHLEKHTGDQIALLSSNIAALKKQQTRYLNINEFEEKSKYISEQEMFYLLFNRVKTNVQKSSNDLYQELCDHLCPSNSFISDFHDHISSVGNNVLESIEELLMIGGDILTKSFNTISVNTDPEKTLSAYIAQSRKSTGLAQMQLLLRNTENLKEAQYLSTTEIKNNSFSVPSIYLEFKHNKYSWTIDNKNSDELIKNYITGRKLTQKDIAYYNKRLSECINNYFSNSESRYRIIPDGEITFYCFLYILAKIFNCNNGFNITHWLEEKCNHSITVNNSWW
jgi:hypothetical protein